MKYTLAVCFTVWGILALLPASLAQDFPTNMQVFSNLGLSCLDSVPAEVDTLVIASPPTLPYVTSALIRHWQQQGKHLFSFDSLRISNSNPVLSWNVSDAEISYGRVNRKTLSRSAKLNLQYTLLGKQGEFLAHDTCRQSFSDEIPKKLVSELESAAYPETQAELPPDRWIRRHLEPVIIAAATALAAFLFFNLRNDSADS